MTDKPHEPHGDDHGHGHGHGSPFIQHHYDDAQHQFDSGKLGIWIFLAQEVLFFSALFVAYIVYRNHHPEIYSYAHKYLDVKFGAINTAVLIFSSLTAAWAVRAAQLGQKRTLVLCLATTIACACGFLGIKYVEYSHKIHEHILFGRYFDPCISSGGRDLLTKNNNCPGTKSTVVWDYGTAKPSTGCYSDIDQDAQAQGVQADCAVKEYALTSTKTRVQQQKKDASGKTVVGADGKPVMETVDKVNIIENFKRDITEKCPDVSPLAHAGGGHHAGKFPCWRTAYQPAVCKKDVGVLVEYGDHQEHKWVRIKAQCKPAPKAAEVGDPLADRAQPLELGKPAIAPRHERSVHEEHELEAMGPPPENTNMFFTIYFAMTGLHGIHVLFGIGVFTWLLIRALKGHFTPDYFGPIDYAALYWHIVDLIWIFLFPLLYLIH